MEEELVLYLLLTEERTYHYLLYNYCREYTEPIMYYVFSCMYK